MRRPLRLAARLLTGSTYILLGADAAREPGSRVGQAATTLAALRKVLPLPADDARIVQANGAVQVLGGTLLALGKLPRLSALALAGSLIPTTIAGHAYWTSDDAAARKLQRIQFHKNMAMLGGLLFAVLDEPNRAAGPKTSPSGPTVGGARPGWPRSTPTLERQEPLAAFARSSA